MLRDIVTVLAGLALAFGGGWKMGSSSADNKLANLKAVHAEQVSTAESAARDTEQKLQNSIDYLSKKAQNDLKVAKSNYDNVIVSLLNRPEARSDSCSSAARTPVGCTGAGLAKADAAFLAGYAADAERLRIAYDQCKIAYDSARSVSNDN